MNYNMKIISIKDNEYPDLLRKIPKPPQKLYTIGNVDLLKSNCIAVVGTRRCSDYGYRIATEFAKKFAGIKVTVVSGLAIRDRYRSTRRCNGNYRKYYCGFGWRI